MKLRHLIGVAAATFGLALAAQAAPAGPAPDGSVLAWTPNGVTLAGAHGPHSGTGGFGGAAPAEATPAPHFDSGMARKLQPPQQLQRQLQQQAHLQQPGNLQAAHLQPGRKLPHLWRSRASRWLAPSPGALARRLVRLGVTGYGTDESCFAECLSAGYSPAYCTANAWSFC